MTALMKLIAILATRGKQGLDLITRLDAARRLLPKDQRESLEGWAKNFLSARSPRARLAILAEAIDGCDEIAESPEEKQQVADWRRIHRSIGASLDASRALPMAARTRSRRRIAQQILLLTNDVVDYTMTRELPKPEGSPELEQ